MADQVQQEQKFGVGQMTNETPNWAKLMFKVFFYITTMVTLALSTFTDIDPAVKLKIAEWVIFGNVAMHTFAQMWGYDDTVQGVRRRN